MRQRVKETIQKIGLSPGTLFIPEGSCPVKSTLNLIQYNEGFFEIFNDISIEEIVKKIRPEFCYWIQVEGTRDVELIQKIGKEFSIHPLFLEDIASASQRPKFDTYADQIYIICHYLHYYDTLLVIEKEQISIAFSKNVLISFAETTNTIFEPIIKRISKENSRIRGNKSDFLCYGIIDLMMDYTFAILDQVDEHIDQLESEFLDRPHKQAMQRIQQTKRLVANLRNSVWPMREVISQFERFQSPLISENTKFYMHDVSDHMAQALDILQNFGEKNQTLVDLYVSSLRQKMNDVMKTLTVVATLFAPLTFVTSLYGMNFKYMPELDWKYGYPITVAILIAITAGMLFYFHRKRWL